METSEAEIRYRLKTDFITYARTCLKIRADEGVLPLKLNESQIRLHKIIEEQKKDKGIVRIIVLKGRQQGISTYVQARLIHNLSHNHGKRALILTQENKATKYIFDIAKRYYQNLPEIMKPHISASNVNELIFDHLDCAYGVATAGHQGDGAGRGQSIQYFHGSEVAFWKNAYDHSQSILPSISKRRESGTEIILESTAKGTGGYFYDVWGEASAGKSIYVPVFLPWYIHSANSLPVDNEFRLTSEEYELKQRYNLRDEQLNWRRVAISDFSKDKEEGERRFKEEYPFYAEEAFQAATSHEKYIQPDVVMKARQSNYSERYGVKFIGVDPARFGDDRTSIIIRHGRVAYGLKSYEKLDNMKITGIVHSLIKEEKPDYVCIDSGGGAGIIDRLKELGYKSIIKEVQFGGSALNIKKYANKRAEMWGEMKDWLLDEPCSIPDNDSLHRDLCTPKYSFKSNSQILLESKEDIKKRKELSPDEGDALALTFAFPAVSNSVNIKKLINPTFRFN
jgi:hypothetical protein